MKCPKCQHESRLGAKFCEECGAPLARACPSCGAELSPTAKFCPECGHRAGQAAAPAAATSQRIGAPETCTPKHLAEKILTLDRALESGLPAFLALLDVPVEDSQWQALDPPRSRQRTLDALKRLLLRESQVQPLGLA